MGHKNFIINRNDISYQRNYILIEEKYMLFKSNSVNIKKKNLIILIFHIHFLILSLIVVLWGKNKLKQTSSAGSSSQVLERKAHVIIAPDKSNSNKTKNQESR